MKRLSLLLALSGTIALSAQAQSLSETQTDTLKQLISIYAEKVKAAAANVKGKPLPVEAFSAENGRQIFLMSRNWEGDAMPACATCHTDDPKQDGQHAVTKKPIKPLAPVANPERFTDAQTVEKNFSKHCRELYSRDCTPMEKGHFLTYLMSVK